LLARKGSVQRALKTLVCRGAGNSGLTSGDALSAPVRGVAGKIHGTNLWAMLLPLAGRSLWNAASHCATYNE
jgi:hypothetical protein